MRSPPVRRDETYQADQSTAAGRDGERWTVNRNGNDNAETEEDHDNAETNIHPPNNQVDRSRPPEHGLDRPGHLEVAVDHRLDGFAAIGTLGTARKSAFRRDNAVGANRLAAGPADADGVISRMIETVHDSSDQNGLSARGRLPYSTNFNRRSHLLQPQTEFSLAREQRTLRPGATIPIGYARCRRNRH